MADFILAIIFIGLLIAGVIDLAFPAEHEGKELKTIYRREDHQ